MTERLRVLQMIDRLGPAGAELLLYTLASGIDHSRFDLHVCGLRDGSMYALSSQLRALGVPVVEFKQRNAYDMPTLLGLVRYIRKHHIDIIHTHLLAADIMGRMAGKLTGVPVVSTVHNSREDFDHEPLRRQWMERWTARLMCRRLVLVSESLRREIVEWYRLPEKRFVTIANGVDTSRFRPRPELDRAAIRRDLLGEAAGSDDSPLVLTVARLVPQKGLSFLLEAARQVCDAQPDVRFAVVGLGPLLDELKAQAERLGIAERLVFAGERDDVPDLLAACDLFAMSSLWEGLPVALLEAMSSGCSVVATQVGGVGDVLQSGKTGLLVPPSDVDALAAAMLACLNDPAASRMRGITAREWISSRYSMQAWVQKLERLYLRESKRRANPLRKLGIRN